MKTKKLLSIFLAVLVIAGIFSIPVSAQMQQDGIIHNIAHKYSGDELVNDPNMPSSTPTEPGDDEEKDPSKITVVEQEEKEDSEFVKTLNNNPLLVGIIAILGFFLLVLILSKVSKIKS